MLVPSTSRTRSVPTPRCALRGFRMKGLLGARLDESEGLRLDPRSRNEVVPLQEVSVFDLEGIM